MLRSRVTRVILTLPMDHACSQNHDQHSKTILLSNDNLATAECKDSLVHVVE